MTFEYATKKLGSSGGEMGKRTTLEGFFSFIHVGLAIEYWDWRAKPPIVRERAKITGLDDVNIAFVRVDGTTAYYPKSTYNSKYFGWSVFPVPTPNVLENIYKEVRKTNRLLHRLNSSCAQRNPESGE